MPYSPLANLITNSTASTGFSFDAKTQNLITSGTAISFAHIDGSGANRLLVVTFLIRDNTVSISGTPTYAGANLSLAKRQVDAGNALSIEIWYMVAPATGSNTLAATLSSAADTRTIVSTYTGASQGVVLDQTGGANGATTVNITPAYANELIVGGSINEDGTLPVIGAGETALFLTDEGTWATAGSYAIQTTATTQAINFTGWDGTQGCIAAASFRVPVLQFDAATNSGYQATASTYNWIHTCSGTSRYLIVGVSMLSVIGSTVSSITYAGSAMTLLGAISSVSGAVRSELWGLIAPATGPNSIVVTLSTGLISAAGAISFTGVHQTVPTEGFASASATNVGAADATVNVTTVAVDDWVVDQVASDDTAITVGAGQVQRNNVTGAGGSGADSTEGPKATPGSVTMSWTNVAALATWSITAIALRDTNASGAATTTSGSTYMLMGI